MRSELPSAPRVPSKDDITALAQVLQRFKVEYVVIGGAAMSLHGFPRMTKDIDLLLPVDAELPGAATAIAALQPDWMNQGFSSTFAGDVQVDLLYVAADQTFEGLRAHLKEVNFEGEKVWTLDLDAMLLTKQTSREEDVPDRLRLQRLRWKRRPPSKVQTSWIGGPWIGA